MFADVPEDEARLMLGEAAVEMFGFDREELVSVSRRIGPLPSELGQDKASRPSASMTAVGAPGRHWLDGPDVPEISKSA